MSASTKSPSGGSASPPGAGGGGPWRRPPAPGQVGALQWKPGAVGLLIVLAGVWGATQFIAARLSYQAALGPAWWEFDGRALYAPWQGLLWLLRFGMDPNVYVRNTLLGAIAILAVSMFVAVGVAMWLLERRARRLSRDQDHLHGSARFGTRADLLAQRLLQDRQGVIIGAWQEPNSNALEYLTDNSTHHILAFAPTRSGKGVSLVIPTLLSWPASAVIYDIKGENFARTAGARAMAGQVVFRFAPTELWSSRFNPLDEVRIFTPRDVSDAQSIANMLVSDGGSRSNSDPHWPQSAASLLTGLILHACYVAHAQGRSASLADLAQILTRPGVPVRDTFQELLTYPHDPDLKLGWKTPNGEPTATHPVVAEKAQEMIDKNEKEQTSVQSTAKTALSLFSDPLVARAVSRSDFRIDDLVNFEKPVSLYIVVPAADRIRLRPIVRLLFTMIVHRLTERTHLPDGSEVRNAYRLLLMIDEFPTLKQMDVFADALSYMAGFGLKAYLVAQDVRQIEAEYGQHESIVTNCQIRVAFAPNQLETAELLSKLSGITTVPRATYHYSGSRSSPRLESVSAAVDYVERPLLTADEVMRIRPPLKEGSGEHERIVAPGEALIFVQGQYVIRGSQLLYFQDAYFAGRSTMQAPTLRYSIEDGKLVPQRDLVVGRTLLAPPELAEHVPPPLEGEEPLPEPPDADTLAPPSDEPPIQPAA